MQQMFMSVSKDLSMNYTDSKEHELTPNKYFPVGTLTNVFVILSSYVV